MSERDDWVELHVNYCEELTTESIREWEGDRSVISFCCESSFNRGKCGEFYLEESGKFTVGDLWVGADTTENFFFVFGKKVLVHRPCNGKPP